MTPLIVDEAPVAPIAPALGWGNADLVARRGTVSTGMLLAELNSLKADTPNVRNGPVSTQSNPPGTQHDGYAVDQTQLSAGDFHNRTATLPQIQLWKLKASFRSPAAFQRLWRIRANGGRVQQSAHIDIERDSQAIQQVDCRVELLTLHSTDVASIHVGIDG